jgi:hypothetical protein
LQTGFYLLAGIPQRLLPHSVAPDVLIYQVLATAMQAGFLFGVWTLALAVDFPVLTRRLVMLACCLLPTALINTLFVWPKMLSIEYLLMLFGLLFYYRPDSTRDEEIVGILCGGLSALAILCHGTSFFALIGFCVTIVFFWHWPSWRTTIYGAATLAATYFPWIFYQTAIDPPANRLMKWHLAGVDKIDARSFITTLRDSYHALTFHSYLAGRLVNFNTMIGNWPRNLVDIWRTVFYHDTKASIAVHAADFFQLIPSLELYSIAVIVVLAVLLFTPLLGGRLSRIERASLYLLVAFIATSATVGILIFVPGAAINHQGTYACQVLITIFAILVLSIRMPTACLVLLAAQCASIVSAYALTLPHDPHYWLLIAICILATMSLLGYSVLPAITPAPSTARPHLHYADSAGNSAGLALPPDAKERGSEMV